MHNASTITMLNAMGVTVYRTTPKAPLVASKPKTQAPLREVALAMPRLATPVLAAPAAAAPQRAHAPIKRAASVQRELVLPQAELKRFVESRMYRHFCLLFAAGEMIAVVENAVLSDTALHFEAPPAGPVKLGSIALLKTNWRKRREAWLAIRLWRKQLKTRT